MKEKKKIKVGFFGTPEFSLNFLKHLFKSDFEICFVVSQPPSKSGRGKKEKKSPVHFWAENKNLKIYVPNKINNKEFQNTILSEKIDFAVVVAYGQIINKAILNSPKYFTLNIHASLLPRWRGAAPVQRAILAGDTSTGVSIMKVEEKLDSGPVFSKKEIKIENNDSVESILEKITLEGKKLLIMTINNIVEDKYTLKTQEEKLVTYANKIKKEESKINWHDKASEILLKIKAFCPIPGAWTFMNNGKRVKILKAEVSSTLEKKNEYDFKKIGECSNNLVVKCGQDFLQIQKLQIEGKSPVSYEEFINGHFSKNIFL